MIREAQKMTRKKKNFKPRRYFKFQTDDGMIC